MLGPEQEREEIKQLGDKRQTPDREDTSPWESLTQLCCADGDDELDLGSGAAAKRRRRAKKLRSKVGTMSFLTKRHRKNGTVSSKDSSNVFISVGSVRDVYRQALDKVYGPGLCQATLCSIKEGEDRLAVCDCEGELSHNQDQMTKPTGKE